MRLITPRLARILPAATGRCVLCRRRLPAPAGPLCARCAAVFGPPIRPA